MREYHSAHSADPSGYDWNAPAVDKHPAGGAQDVANFRENIAAGKLPLPSDVTFEGLCKEYYFDTVPRQEKYGRL